MKALQKNQLRTVRFAPREAKVIDSYLKQNPVFDSFSALARVATLAFIGEKGTVYLNPVRLEKKSTRPSFMWDYNLSELETREILNKPGSPQKKLWLIERILTQARFKEIFSYVTVEMIRQALPHLRLQPKVRRQWEYALQRWSKHGQN